MHAWAGAIALACLLASPASAVDLRPVPAQTAIAALAIGQTTDLTTPEDANALWVRLIEMPEDSPSDCVPETHSICGFRYLVTAVEKGEAPQIAVYDLGVLGEVIARQLLRTDAEETVRVRLLILDRPRAVALRTPAEIHSTKLLDVTIGLDRAFVEEAAAE
jgi:hypothetical protein